MARRPPTPTTGPVFGARRAARQPPQLHHCRTATCRVPAYALADAHARADPRHHAPSAHHGRPPCSRPATLRFRTSCG